VYWPSPELSSSFLPVLVFLPPQIRPFSSRKLLFSSFGANIAEQMDVVVVIPDLTNYPEGRIKQQVIDARRVMNWVDVHIHRYGGDSRKLQLSGLGMSGLLAQLLPLQAAIAKSRDQFLHKEKSATRYDLPNGVKDVKVSCSSSFTPVYL
jgi:acetyl esterase/lipase